MKVNYRISMQVSLEKSNSTRDGKSRVFIRVTVSGRTRYFYLRTKIQPHFFDPRAGRIRANFPDAKKLNASIDKSMRFLTRQLMDNMVLDQHKGEQTTKNYLNGLTLLSSRHEDKQ